MALETGEVIEILLALDAAKESGAYTVKHIATTRAGERVVDLVDCVVE